MPELPEVETVRLFLDKHIIGKTISKLEIINPKSYIGNPNLVEGQKIISTSRLGKQLSLHLQNGQILLFHLKMTGQIIIKSSPSPARQDYEVVGRSRESRETGSVSIFGHPTPKEDKSNLPNKSTRLVFTFSDNTILYFNDQRKFGWVKLLSQSGLVESQKNVGVDILSPKFTPLYFYNHLQKSRRAVKTVLLDQSKYAGIGNIYANDALFLSHLHPQIPANKVTPSQAKILHKNIIKLIKESLLHGGSTAKDNKYIHPDGSTGQHQYYFRVYQREGEPCLVCQTPIKRIVVGARGTFYCPKCQNPSGKIKR